MLIHTIELTLWFLCPALFALVALFVVARHVGLNGSLGLHHAYRVVFGLALLIGPVVCAALGHYLLTVPFLALAILLDAVLTRGLMWTPEELERHNADFEWTMEAA